MLSGSSPVEETEPEAVRKVVVEEEISAGDYVLAQQEMVVEEGILGSQRLVGPCVVVVAERLASFLLLLDGRLPADSHIFIDKEASWLRNSMDLKPVGIQYTSLEAILDGSWRSRKSEDITFLIQGSNCLSSERRIDDGGIASFFPPSKCFEQPTMTWALVTPPTKWWRTGVRARSNTDAALAGRLPPLANIHLEVGMAPTPLKANMTLAQNVLDPWIKKVMSSLFLLLQLPSNIASNEVY